MAQSRAEQQAQASGKPAAGAQVGKKKSVRRGRKGGTRETMIDAHRLDDVVDEVLEVLQASLAERR